MQFMTRHRGRVAPWVLGVIGLLVIGLGVTVRYLGTPPSAQPLLISAEPLDVNGIYLDQPKPVVDFSLTEGAGGDFTAANFSGKWTFIYFGYTFCPDVCPMTFAQLTKAQQQLAEQGADDNTAYLLISVDPARDTPQRLQEYVSSFNPQFSGVTGDREEIDKLTEALGVYYKIHDPEPGEDFYLVDHTSALLLINPQAELQAVLTPPFSPATLAEDFLKIRQRYDDSAS